MSKFEQRFRGQALTCNVCGKIIRAATLIVLRKLETEHYRACDVAQAKKKADAACALRQGSLFE